MDNLRIIVFVSLGAMSFMAQSQSFYKCKDKNGHLVFSQISCGSTAEKIDHKNSSHRVRQKPALEQLRDLREINNPKPNDPRSVHKPVKDKCPFIQSTERRNMLVRRMLFRCMTKSEVNRVMKRDPDDRHIESDGEESWYYHHSNGDSTHFYFDSKGRVESWSGWR